MRVAEFVLPGHPDKVADAIADRIVAAALARDPIASAGIEVAVYRSLTVVTGCVVGAGASGLDVRALVEEVHTGILGPDRRGEPGRCVIELEARDLTTGELESRGHVACDQSIVTGWASTVPGTDALPVEHAVARRIAIALWHLHIARRDLSLGPDGKVFVAIRETGAGGDVTWAVNDVTVSIQHQRGWDEPASRRAIADAVALALDEACDAIPGLSLADGARTPHVNPGGPYFIGGTHSDNGLSGKKLAVDFYGPHVPIGGGALSGKDFASVDRAGALVARDLALRIVAGWWGARTCEVTLAIRPGDEAFRVARVISDDGARFDLGEVSSHVDLGVGSRLDWPFRHGALTEVARWGHFAPLPTFT